MMNEDIRELIEFLLNLLDIGNIHTYEAYSIGIIEISIDNTKTINNMLQIWNNLINRCVYVNVYKKSYLKKVIKFVEDTTIYK